MRNIIKHNKITWIDVQNPTKEDVRWLKEHFEFHPLVLEELIPPGYRPAVEYHPDYLFLILHYPIYSKEKKETTPRELDIIATKDTIVTSHYQTIFPLKALFDQCNLYQESKKVYLEKGSGYLLFYILDGLLKNYLTKIVKIGQKIDKIEKEIFQGKEKTMVREISLFRTDTLDFRRIISPQKEIFDSLQKEGVSFFGKELIPYFSDLLGTFGRVLLALQDYQETISVLAGTNQALLDTKTNEEIKILTIFSVVILPLTLIASIWGMNISLPFQRNAFGFLILILIMAGTLALMIFYFRKKKWF
ncbi:MAG: magnesium transporter CorA family protein [Patescibacteria group bacterium]|nr:magnesium transporter CorA family protein [Patescibacteria group bacterium]